MIRTLPKRPCSDRDGARSPATVFIVITRTTSGWVAGLVALAFFGAACSSASGPEVVEPAAAPAETGADPSGGSSTDPATAEQGNDSTGESGGEAEGGAESPTAEPETETSESTVPSVPVPEALQFTAPLVGGGEIDLAAGFDNKPTVFWFWAPT